MRIVHIADTHAGYRAYNALDELGINQREADVYQAFEQAVDKILKIHPDVIIHAGDLFDTPRPSNRALSFVLKQLLRFSKEDIPVVMITGNHSTPRMRDTGSIFQLFALLPNFYPVFEGNYDTIHLPATTTKGKLTIHAIPHCLKKEDFNCQLEQVSINSETRYNVLVLHAAVTGIKEFSMGEFNEQEIQTGYLDPQFDYIALGHYHQLTQVEENCFYSGSIERFSFNELNQKKGFIEFNLATKEIEFHELDIRHMEDLGIIRASNLSTEMVTQKLEDILGRSEIDNKIVRLTVEDISTPAYNALDFPKLRNLTAPALHFDLRFAKKEETLHMQAPTSSIGRLTDEFRSYIAGIAIDDYDKEKIMKQGLEYLEAAAHAGEGDQQET